MGHNDNNNNNNNDNNDNDGGGGGGGSGMILISVLMACSLMALLVAGVGALLYFKPELFNNIFGNSDDGEGAFAATSPPVTPAAPVSTKTSKAPAKAGAFPQNCKAGRGENVSFYEHEKYTGRVWKLKCGRYNEFTFNTGGTFLSSVKVPSKLKVFAFSEKNFGGECLVIGGNTEALKPFGFDNRIKSAMIVSSSAKNPSGAKTAKAA